jgi:hypothetical protein
MNLKENQCLVQKDLILKYQKENEQLSKSLEEKKNQFTEMSILLNEERRKSSLRSNVNEKEQLIYQLQQENDLLQQSIEELKNNLSSNVLSLNKDVSENQRGLTSD